MEPLEDWLSQRRDGREIKRGLCVKMVLEGMEGKKVAALLGMVPASVTKWKKRYVQGGVDALALGYRGGAGFLTSEQKEQVFAWLETRIAHKQPVSVEVLRAEIEARFGVVYRSRQSYYDWLHAARVSYHKTQKQNPKRDEEQVQERREAIKKVAHQWRAIKAGELVVLFQDECHLLWGDVVGYAWGARGQRLEVSMTNFRERQSYYGAFELLSGALKVLPFGAGNGENTVAYLRVLLNQYTDKRLWIVWDGASYHRNEQVRALLQEVNAGLEEDHWRLTLIPLAPHAPEQNPIEDAWLAGKRYVRRNYTLLKTFTHVKQAFFAFFQNFHLHSTKFLWYQPNS